MIICRRATPDELGTIMDLEIRTFTGEQEIPEEMNYLPDSCTPQWFCALEDGAIVGAIAFFSRKRRLACGALCDGTGMQGPPYWDAADHLCFP